MKFQVKWFAASVALFLAALPMWAAGPFVKGLSTKYAGNNLVVSLTVASAFDRPDLKEAILSTRPVSITFTIEVQRRRGGWLGGTLIRRKITHAVTYDNLTRRYSLETITDGASTDKQVVETWDEMVKYMEEISEFTVTSVANLDPAEGAYALRAQVHLLNDYVWVIPWDVQTPWAVQNLSTP